MGSQKNQVFSVVMCNLLDRYCIRETCHFLFNGRRVWCV